MVGLLDAILFIVHTHNFLRRNVLFIIANNVELCYTSDVSKCEKCAVAYLRPTQEITCCLYVDYLPPLAICNLLIRLIDEPRATLKIALE